MFEMELAVSLLVFLGGILSFFSPCIIPLIPVYISYLAGNGKKRDENGNIIYVQKKVFLHTLFFILGISVAFFMLGISFSVLGDFIFENKDLVNKIGGLVIIAFGLFQLGVIDFSFLQKERKIHFEAKEMGPIAAFLTGFTFSFAWTPCIGPILSSVLIMASSSQERFTGNILILIYTLGFVLPFLLLGIFTTTVLNFLRRNQKLLKYTVKIGGILLIVIGMLTFSGVMNRVTGYLSGDGDFKITQNLFKSESNKEVNRNFQLKDQYGIEHKLSDYKGKVVFLNFWATWCPPCREEMPYIDELYKEYGDNKEDVIFLGVANPLTDENPYAQDEYKERIEYFIKVNGYTFPTVFDETGDMLKAYRISAFPTTFIIGRDGEIKKIIPGGLTKEMMKNLIENYL